MFKMDKNFYVLLAALHMPFSAWHRDWIITDGAIDRIVRVILILIISIIVVKVVNFTLDKSKRLAVDRFFRQTGLSNTKRMDTVYNTLKNVTTVTLLTIAAGFLLGEFNINLAPLVAGASFLAVALGLGAQALVKDILYGFFILAEDQFSLGDIIQVGDNIGQVESMNLRSISLRDQSGRVHVIPNGEASKVTVYTHGWSAMSLDLYVPYNADLDKVFDTLEAVNKTFYKNNKQYLLEAPKNLGIDDFTDKGVLFKIIAKTQAQQQWQLTRLYRRAVKQAFDTAEIKLSTLNPGPVSV